MKIKISDMQTFLITYYQGDYPEQRLGQAFMNVVQPSQVNPDIFYETDDKKAIQKIYDTYVNIP